MWDTPKEASGAHLAGGWGDMPFRACSICYPAQLPGDFQSALPACLGAAAAFHHQSQFFSHELCGSSATDALLSDPPSAQPPVHSHTSIVGLRGEDARFTSSGPGSAPPPQTTFVHVLTQPLPAATRPCPNHTSSTSYHITSTFIR